MSAQAEVPTFMEHLLSGRFVLEDAQYLPCQNPESIFPDIPAYYLYVIGHKFDFCLISISHFPIMTNVFSISSLRISRPEAASSSTCMM